MKTIKIFFILFIIIVLQIPLTSMASALLDATGNISTNNSANTEITNPTDSLNTGNAKPNDSSNIGTITPGDTSTALSSTNLISVSSESVTPNTEFYLILNLANISYNNFKVEISNTANLTANTVTSTVSALELNSTITSFIIDKSLINLDKLGIVYTSTAQETNIAFSVTITNLDDTTKTLENELKLLETEINNLQTELLDLEKKLLETDSESEEYSTLTESIEKLKKNIEEKNLEKEDLVDKINNFTPEVLEAKTTITVRKEAAVETEKENMNTNDKTQNKPWDDKDSLLEEMDKDKSKEMTSSMKKMMEEMTKLESNLKTANDTISSLTKTVTYQGSQNNYLKSLSISNIEFKNNFKKTTLNYFVNVDENTTSVTVNAVPEDSSAIVTIYGNTDLQSGKNKILITVTADDGSVRTYKIYVIK